MESEVCMGSMDWKWIQDVEHRQEGRQRRYIPCKYAKYLYIYI
jgi:hypothetical protein